MAVVQGEHAGRGGAPRRAARRIHAWALVLVSLALTTMILAACLWAAPGVVALGPYRLLGPNCRRRFVVAQSTGPRTFAIWDSPRSGPLKPHSPGWIGQAFAAPGAPPPPYPTLHISSVVAPGPGRLVKEPSATGRLVGRWGGFTLAGPMK